MPRHFFGRLFNLSMTRLNPAYTEVANIVYTHPGFSLRDIPNEKIGINVLRKNENVAYIEEPYG